MGSVEQHGAIVTKCYARLAGGVGNQLFITAAAYAYSKKYNKELCLDGDNWVGHQGKPANEYRDTIFKNFIYDSSYLSGTTPILEKRCNYDDPPEIDGSVAFCGYFQSLKYFEEYKDDFIKELNLPEVDVSILNKKNVAFHIRRGDYLTFKDIYGICGTKYFEDHFKKFEDYQINVFTDSPEHVLDEFEKYDFNLIQTSSELNDLTLMSKHDSMVCSNSTFSWWASLIGNTKTVIVPDKWFLDGREHEDIYRPDMIKYEL